MTFAWYGHLKFKHHPLWMVILASWGIAFFEYCPMAPANRWGNARFSAVELKIMQEVITYLGVRIRWNHLAAFACIVVAVAFAFLPEGTSVGKASETKPAPPASADGSRSL